MIHIKRLIPVLFLLLLVLTSAQGEGEMSPETLRKVGQAMLTAEGKGPAALFKAVKEANPGVDAIKSIRDFNSQQAKSGFESGDLTKIRNIQGTAQKQVRQKVLEIRPGVLANYRTKNPKGARSLYGYGDVGSWVNASDPDASMDIDWTILGVDPDVTAEVRDSYQAELMKTLDPNGEGLTLQDFDVVVTAEGHETQAHVFESKGGKDWAKRNMKDVVLIDADGNTRRVKLDAGGDPVAEMGHENRMAKLRDLTTKNGDYDKMFKKDAEGRTSLVDNPPPDLLAKYGDMLGGLGVDSYRSRTSTAAGGCLDMAKHLKGEVLTQKHEPRARLKKTLKYLYRADNITRVGDLQKLIASDPFLSDPANRELVKLARQITTASGDAQTRLVDSYLEKHGDAVEAHLAELGDRAAQVLLKMAEVSSRAQMDNIVLKIKDQGPRGDALRALADDFRIISGEGGEYSEQANKVLDTITMLEAANKDGIIAEIQKNAEPIKKLREAKKANVERTKAYLNESELGKKILEQRGSALDFLSTPLGPETGFTPESARFASEISNQIRGTGLKAVDLLGSASMWVEVVNNVQNSKSDAELAVAISKTLVTNTFYGLVLTSGYQFVQGDNEGLIRMVSYMLVPEAAMPALMEMLAVSATNAMSKALFDNQLEAQYQLTEWAKDGTVKNIDGYEGVRVQSALSLVNALIETPDLAIGMFERAMEKIRKEAGRENAELTETGQGIQVLGKRALGKVLVSVVDKGERLVFPEEPRLAEACENIKRYTEEINYLAKTVGVEVPLQAAVDGPWREKVAPGEGKAIANLIVEREKWREKTRERLATAIVESFEARHRAEGQLNEGKVLYDELLGILAQLKIKEPGLANLDAEGAPYNIITRWWVSEKEAQVQAVKTVQRFLDAYRQVLAYRASAQQLARVVLGDGFKNAYPPLTDYPTLTGNPDQDLAAARAYIVELKKLGAGVSKWMEVVKQEPLEGDYDDNMFRRMYLTELRYLYWQGVVNGATTAQQNTHALKVLTKLDLSAKRDQAHTEQSQMHDRLMDLQKEYKEYYTRVPVALEVIDSLTKEPVEDFHVVARSERGTSEANGNGQVQLELLKSNYEFKIDSPTHQSASRNVSVGLAAAGETQLVRIELVSSGLQVSLHGLPAQLEAGDKLDVKARVQGGKAPFDYQWFLGGKEQPKATGKDSLTGQLRKLPGSYNVRVVVTDANKLEGTAEGSFNLVGSLLTVRVLDSGTNPKAGISGATVTATVNGKSIQAQTGGDGTARMAVGLGSQADLQVKAAGYSAGASAVALEQGVGHATVELSKRTAKLNISVRDGAKQDSAGLEGAKVVATVDGQTVVGYTDANGHLELDIPAGAEVTVRVIKDGYNEAKVTKPIVDGKVKVGGDLKPIEQASVAVVLRDAETGLPIPGASVVVGQNSGTTNSEGAVTVSVPPETEVTLKVSKSGYQSRSKTSRSPALGKTVTARWKLEPLKEAAPVTTGPSGSYAGWVKDNKRSQPYQGLTLTTRDNKVYGTLRVDRDQGVILDWNWEGGYNERLGKWVGTITGTLNKVHQLKGSFIINSVSSSQLQGKFKMEGVGQASGYEMKGTFSAGRR